MDSSVKVKCRRELSIMLEVALEGLEAALEGAEGLALFSLN
jgi:hypothetical protein